MRRLILARLVDLAFVLFGVSIIVFLMIRLIPGDAVQIMLGANTEITPERLAALYHKLGIDRPILEQYLSWAAGVLSGDLGNSVWTGAPVAEEIFARIGVTAELMATSLTLAVLIAIPAGSLMA